MKSLLFLFIGLSALLTLCVQIGSAAEPLAKDRIAQVAAWLPEQPSGPGRPISDRAFWEKFTAPFKGPFGPNTNPQRLAWLDLIPRAEKLLATPLPEQPDELFLEFSRTGNRTHWQDVAAKRRGRLTSFVLAECVENKGRFVPAIEVLIAALCAEKTWVMPAHDGKLENFNGKTIDIDLASSALGWNMAMADYLLGDKLDAPSRALLRDNVKRRILDPYKAMIRGERPLNWWMTGTNNWNAVCLAGVTGAALIEAPAREERAEFVVAAENYSKYFLAGFTPDGYCSEGLGYWNYGFGHYVLLSEAIRRATESKLDFLTLPAAKMPARFASRIQIINGIAPAFADCGVFAKPSAPLTRFLSRRVNFNDPNATFFLTNDNISGSTTQASFSTLFEAILYNTTIPADFPVTPRFGGDAVPLRDWFDSAGILICRPPDEDKEGLPNEGAIGVALKGGNNAENHNHNDIGSYVVVSGERPVLLDPGNETYTARTFSAHRYDSKLLSSFGHPVPIVAGQLQKEGAKSQGKVLKTEFSDARDTLQLDIASAYPVPELKTLARTFVYSREAKGALSVADHVTFTTPKAFGTAVLTLGSWQKQADGSLLIFDVEEALRVEIDTDGREYSIDAEEIHEDAPVVPTRLGINLKEPVSDATITLKITPFIASGPGGSLLRNGNFEMGAWGWELPKNGMGSLSTERAASGQTSLKISDADKQGGSNVTSGRASLQPQTRYMLRGKVFHATGQGVGLYIKFFDANHQLLNSAEANGNIAPVGTTPVIVGRWENFAFPFQTPPGTASAQVWIHSFNAAESELFLDDLEIVEQR